MRHKVKVMKKQIKRIEEPFYECPRCGYQDDMGGLCPNCEYVGRDSIEMELCLPDGVESLAEYILAETQ